MKLHEDRKRLLELADGILDSRCPSITDFRAPDPGAGIHDYYSEATYWHPDPEKPDGLPYIKKDGILNKDKFNKHQDMIVDVKRSLSILYWAYENEKDSRYIDKIKDILYTFFVDPEKYVDPYLEHSKGIKGICKGRSTGIIDFDQLVTVPLLLRYLEKNNLVDDEFASPLEAWCTRYSHWLEESEFGHTESVRGNNHSVAFYMQLAAFSMFRPDWKKLREKISRVFKNQLIPLMAPDGSMPQELKRTRPYWYSIFSVDLLVNLAKLISTEDDNLMEYEDEEGRSVRKAVYYIVPYMKDKSSWFLPPDIERWENVPLADTFLYIAGREYGDEDFIALFDTLPEAIFQNLEIERNVAVFAEDLFY